MYNPLRPTDPALENAIDNVYDHLENVDPCDGDKHDTMVQQLEKLYALKPKSYSPDTLLTVAGNIAITVAVIKYEQTGIIVTKAAQFWMKFR